jgi:acylphosphatase
MVRTVHVIVFGKVQGVGYRAWTEYKARSAGLAGWVRNRQDGSVEALFSGDPEAVDAMAQACRKGPRLSAVVDVIVTERAEQPPPDFHVLPTQ